MHRIPWLFLLIILPFTAGCGRVNQLHFLKGDFTLSHQSGIHLDLMHVAPDLNLAAGRSLVVQVLEPEQTIAPPTKIGEKVDWPVWWLDYEQHLADRLWQTTVFSDVSTASDAVRIKDPDLVLKVAVTQWHEGNGWLRYLIGFGAGATQVQWEGALLDARTDRVLMAFADRRIHPGGPSMFWFGWRRALNAPALISEDLRYGTGDLCKGLRRLTGVKTDPLKRWQRRPLYRNPSGTPDAASSDDGEHAGMIEILPDAVEDGQP